MVCDIVCTFGVHMFFYNMTVTFYTSPFYITCLFLGWDAMQNSIKMNAYQISMIMITNQPAAEARAMNASIMPRSSSFGDSGL